MGAIAESLPRTILLAQQPAAQQGGENPPAAADGEPEAGNGAAAESKKPLSAESLGMMIINSDWLSLLFYIVLLIFSIVTAAVAFERAVNLRRAKVIPPGFVTAVSQLNAASASRESLRQIAESNPSPIGRIFKAGAIKAGRPLVEVEKAMEDAASREMQAIRGRSKALSVMGNVAPLVGLQGTVVGMIFAFKTASEEGLGKAESLAGGIYLALFTTAIGLTIAIPALLCLAWFQSRADRFMREADEILLETLPVFEALEDQHGRREELAPTR